jgi:hypothetical protein
MSVVKMLKVCPRDKKEWLRFAFYALATLVISMAARVVKLDWTWNLLRFPTPFYIVYYSAILALLLVSIRIAPFYPLHARFGIGAFFLSLWFYLPFNVGILLCLIVSPLTPLPRSARYHCALFFSLIEVLGYSFVSAVHYPGEEIPYEVNGAFGLVFALVRVWMSPRFFSPTGWLIILFHGFCLFQTLLWSLKLD